MATIRNLVFEGGGAAGVAYAGALAQLEELEKQNLFSFKDVQRVGGTSVGSLTALLVSLNYSSADITHYLKTINFNQLKDDDMGVIRDLHRLDTKYGFYKGEALLQIIRKFLEEKTGNADATFGDLKKLGFKDLYVVTTKVYKRDESGTCEPVIFSFENAWDTPVAPVLLASASIPGFFKRVRLKKQADGQYIMHSTEGHAFVDGGLLNNFPITLFDNTRYMFSDKKQEEKTLFNLETLGLRLDTTKEIADLRDTEPTEEIIPDGKPLAYFSALLNGCTLGQQNYTFRQGIDKYRTIFIDRQGTDATDFDMSEKKKEELVLSGKKGVTDFFKKKFSSLQAANDAIMKDNNNVFLPQFEKKRPVNNRLFQPASQQRPPATVSNEQTSSFWEKCNII